MMIKGAFGNGFKGAKSASEVTSLLGSTSVALVQGLTPVALGCACMLSRFSHVWLFVTVWTIACQAPLSKGFCKQEYWSRLSCPPSGGLPDPGIEPKSPATPALQADFLPSEPPGKVLGAGLNKSHWASSETPAPEFRDLGPGPIRPSFEPKRRHAHSHC